MPRRAGASVPPSKQRASVAAATHGCVGDCLDSGQRARQGAMPAVTPTSPTSGLVRGEARSEDGEVLLQRGDQLPIVHAELVSEVGLQDVDGFSCHLQRHGGSVTQVDDEIGRRGRRGGEGPTSYCPQTLLQKTSCSSKWRPAILGCCPGLVRILMATSISCGFARMGAVGGGEGWQANQMSTARHVTLCQARGIMGYECDRGS